MDPLPVIVKTDTVVMDNRVKVSQYFNLASDDF
jgi:hypothetical protein